MLPNRTIITEYFSPHGLLAGLLPDYEAREGQLVMAAEIFETLETGGPIVIEAGTGIGKTLAYLIPAVLSGRKIVISTGTKNLQDQIISKDIPFIQQTLAPDLKVTCVKGRKNYLCLYRWKQQIAGKNHGTESGKQLMSIRNWLEQTATGDRSELEWLQDHSPLWQEISSSSSQCLGMHCPDYTLCFISKLRKEAAKASIVVTNHHLFFSDLAVRQSGHAEVLPRYESVIFDEAHNLENVASQYFGVSVSHVQIQDLAADMEKSATQDLDDATREKTIEVARLLAGGSSRFAAIFPGVKGRFGLQKFIAETPSWQSEVDALLHNFAGTMAHLQKLTLTRPNWEGLLNRAEHLLRSLETIAFDPSSSYIYWFERTPRNLRLSASPLEIAPEMQELYTSVRSAVFTSATLATGNNFNYFITRMGLPTETETLALASPYDYKTQSMIYVPDNPFPEPANPAFASALMQEIHDIILASNGRALILFTSRNNMQMCNDYLHPLLPATYTLLQQGDAPKNTLLEKFRQDTHSVLLAVASFWEGVDIPGESLSCVVIDKLPFEVPSDPVIMARMQKIETEGSNPFIDFQIPRAILALRQGVGRLIRSSRDRGLIAILDIRLFSKRYGRLFRDSLPPSPVFRTMDAVRDFFRAE